MNMKHSNLYIITTMLATLWSCSKVEGPSGVDLSVDGVVRISASVDAPVTKADSKIYDGANLGLFIDYGDGDNYTKSNVLWNNDGSNNWTPETQMLWKSVTIGAKVYAYSPYIEGQNNPANVQITIPTDQSAGVESADYLWWYPEDTENGKVKAFVPEKNLTDGRIDIAFRHALIKLTVNLEPGNQFDGKTLSVKEAWFHRSSNMVKIDFTGSNSSGVPCVAPTVNDPASNVCSIKMHDCSTEGKLSCEVLFFPYSLISGAKLLTVTLSDGRDYTLTLDKDLDLKKSESGAYVVGTAYEMTVKIGKEKLEMGTVTVAPWIDKGSLGDDKKFGTDATEFSKWGGAADVATEYAGGDGTENNPYEIATAAQLAFLAQECNKTTYRYGFKYFRLTADIDLQGHEWTPIGVWGNEFAGVFDGGGHVIINLKVSNSDGPAGLFGGVKGNNAETATEIKDLVIRNAFVSSTNYGYSGIVAGICKIYDGNCNISGCKVDGTVFSNCVSGGILGDSFSGPTSSYVVSITNCTADVSCTVADVAEDAMHACCGGIAGLLERGTISGCTVRGNVEGMEGTVYVGGLAGQLLNSSTGFPFNYVYAQVGISKASGKNCYIGGLAGAVIGEENQKITSCRMYGKVWCAEGLNSPVYIGGAVGYVQNADLGGLYFYGSVEAGKLADGVELYAGAFIGSLGNNVTASDCTYQIDGAVGLPVYGHKAEEGVDDSGIYVETRE